MPRILSLETSPYYRSKGLRYTGRGCNSLISTAASTQTCSPESSRASSTCSRADQERYAYQSCSSSNEECCSQPLEESFNKLNLSCSQIMNPSAAVFDKRDDEWGYFVDFQTPVVEERKVLNDFLCIGKGAGPLGTVLEK